MIELFTSQGCASCQPAAKIMSELAREPGNIALTFPVTYWDYLGWKDNLGLAAFSERQRAYASAHGERQVFTPQAIVNGARSMVGSDRASLDDCVREVRAAAVSVPIRLEHREPEDRISIDVAAGGEPGMQAEVWILPVLRSRAVTVGKGENQGQVIVYANVVRDLHRVGTWTGEATRYEVPGAVVRTGEADAYVVILQGGVGARPGPILGAAKGPGF